MVPADCKFISAVLDENSFVFEHEELLLGKKKKAKQKRCKEMALLDIIFGRIQRPFYHATMKWLNTTY